MKTESADMSKAQNKRKCSNYKSSTEWKSIICITQSQKKLSH